MTELEGQLLGLLAIYGYAIIFGIVLVGALGVPMPSAVVLLAAGAIAVEGDLSVVLVIAVAAAAAGLGDCLIYLLARFVGRAAVVRLGKRVGLTEARIETTQQRVGGWLGLSVFITRWLVTPLALVLDLLAGVGKYPLPFYALLCFTGELLWAVVYVGVGYVFGESWANVAGLLGDGTELVAGVLILAIGIYVVLKVPRTRKRTPSPSAVAIRRGS